MRRAAVIALVPLLALLPMSGTGLPDGGVTRVLTLAAVALPCDGGVCLGYDGLVPGPTLDVRLGDVLVVTLENRIAETIAGLDAPEELRDRLSRANVSLHTHGLTVPAHMDGVGEHAGTALVPSVAPPGGAFTYVLRAGLVGAWHYHDHVLGPDGAEGMERGLYGAVVVRGGVERPPDAVFDVHVTNGGVNGGRGMDAAVAAGSSFEIVFVGLGDLVWDVLLEAPDGSAAFETRIGPGMSERARVATAAAGTYRWSVTWGPQTYEGEVVAS